jgi:hypothetical protein
MTTPSGGFMSGSCRFNPGSNDAPSGEAFDVAIGEFELVVPDFIY